MLLLQKYGHYSYECKYLINKSYGWKNSNNIKRFNKYKKHFNKIRPTTKPIYKNNNQISFASKDIPNEHKKIYEDEFTKDFSSDIENMVNYSDVSIKTNLSTT